MTDQQKDELIATLRKLLRVNRDCRQDDGCSDVRSLHWSGCTHEAVEYILTHDSLYEPKR